MKKVSIIIPIYNSEKYLEKCIESTLKQTYSNIEIILVNDGSTDNSLNICKQFERQDKRIIIIDKKNSGVSDSRNVGIKTSSGQYLCFIDSDDIVDKRYVEYLVRDIEETNFSVAKNVLFKDENKISNESIQYNSRIIQKEDFIELSKEGILNPPWAKCYNKEIIVSNNIYFQEHLSLGEDLLFNLEYLKFIEKARIVDSNLYLYRMSNGDSLAFKYRENMDEIQLLLLEKYEEFFKNSKDIKIFNREIIFFICLVVKNYLNNKSISIFKRIKSAKRFLNRDDIKGIIASHKIGVNRVKYFLFKYNLVVAYYVYLKTG